MAQFQDLYRLHSVYATFQTRLCKLAVGESKGAWNESDMKMKLV